jgi:hypothetical protein
MALGVPRPLLINETIAEDPMKTYARSLPV